MSNPNEMTICTSICNLVSKLYKILYGYSRVRCKLLNSS